MKQTFTVTYTTNLNDKKVQHIAASKEDEKETLITLNALINMGEVLEFKVVRD